MKNIIETKTSTNYVPNCESISEWAKAFYGSVIYGNRLKAIKSIIAIRL